MTKSELIDALAERRTDLTKARAELVVNCVFDAMTEALQRGEVILVVTPKALYLRAQGQHATACATPGNRRAPGNRCAR